MGDAATGKGRASWGGADSARPGIRRMLSGIRQAAPCRPRSRLFACPSSGPSARVAPAAVRTDRGTCVWRGFRHGPWRPFPARHVRHRPGPVTRPSPALSGRRGHDPGPVAGFPPASSGTCRTGLAPPRTDAASGTPMASASRSPPRHVSAPGPGHSLPPASKRSRSIRQREWSEYGMGVEGVGKEGGLHN